MNPMCWWRFEGGPVPEPPLRRVHASGWRSAALALALAVGCTPDSVAPPAEHRPPSPMATRMAAPFDVAAAIDRVRFAFRADGDGWSGGHDTYAVHATDGALAVTPLLREEASAPGRWERIVAGAEATFHAASVARGSVRLTSGDGAGVVDRDGKLSIDRGAVVESLENRAGGVEQSWSFTRRPTGLGDLSVRVAVTGEDFVAGTSTGLHFRDARTGLGVRYGHGSWVDAAGVHTPVPARWDGAAIVLTVPSAVVDGAAYPAVLDPAIAPEFGVDRAPPGPADGTSPALASDDHVFLLVWQSGQRHRRGVARAGRACARHGKLRRLDEPSQVGVSALQLRPQHRLERPRVPRRLDCQLLHGDRRRLRGAGRAGGSRARGARCRRPPARRGPDQQRVGVVDRCRVQRTGLPRRVAILALDGSRSWCARERGRRASRARRRSRSLTASAPRGSPRTAPTTSWRWVAPACG